MTPVLLVLLTGILSAQNTTNLPRIGHVDRFDPALDGLISPEQLAFDDHGNLYVTDESGHAVFRISPDGGVEQFITEEQGLQCPEAIVSHGSHLYLTDSCSVAIFRFALDGSGGPFIRFTRKYRFRPQSRNGQF